MENSSQAFLKNLGGNAPPSIIDIHTELWHLRDLNGLWNRAVLPADYKRTYIPCKEDLLIHICAHSLLYHGCLLEKTVNDINLILRGGTVTSKVIQKAPPPCPSPSRGEGRGEPLSFDWELLCEESTKNGLNQLMYSVLTRIMQLPPEEVRWEMGNGRWTKETETALIKLKPCLAEKLSALIFLKAVKKNQPSTVMEYLLPLMVRPELAWKYLFPEKEFMERRYGGNSLKNRILRPVFFFRKIL